MTGNVYSLAYLCFESLEEQVVNSNFYGLLPFSLSNVKRLIKEVDSLTLTNAQLNLDKIYKFFSCPTVGFIHFNCS